MTFRLLALSFQMQFACSLTIMLNATAAVPIAL